jgi:hypothetical protein
LSEDIVWRIKCMGRPKKNISAKAVYELARIGCSLEEMGRVLDCDETTIGRRLPHEIERGKADLKVRLRRKQLDIALNKGNVAMLIFLGKQLLGQTDRTRTELTGGVAAEIKLSREEQEARIHELVKRGYGVDLELKRAEGARNLTPLKDESEK